ncbi:hypothetical protein [Solemya velesiana gill symbiont]|nr:hypothetical protein [Solemya velesiana gill symbiont]
MLRFCQYGVLSTVGEEGLDHIQLEEKAAKVVKITIGHQSGKARR